MRAPLIAAPMCVLAALSPVPAQPPAPGSLLVGNPNGWAFLHAGPFVQLSVGPSNVAALRADGAAVVWIGGAPGVDPGPYIRVAAGGPHATEDKIFALRPDGSVVALLGSQPSQPPQGPFVDLTATTAGVILRRPDGTLSSWGICYPCATLPAGPFSTVEAGGTVAIGIRGDGTLEMWGPNFSSLPAPPGGAFSAVSVDYANSSYVLGIRTDGTIAAWGSPSHPPPAPPPGTYKAVDAAEPYPVVPNVWAIAVRTDGTLVAWGDTPAGIAQVPAGKFVDVKTAYGTAVALAGCYADCDDSTTLTVTDFGCFQTRFISASQYADCTGEGQFTVADFGCFQTQYVKGCP